MLPLSSSLHATSNPRCTTLDPLPNILDSIPNGLSSFAGNAIDSLADTTAYGTNDAAYRVSYARDSGTAHMLAIETQ
jgi:hypothetical protein